jgi:hypothetical protein
MLATVRAAAGGRGCAWDGVSTACVCASSNHPPPRPGPPRRPRCPFPTTLQDTSCRSYSQALLSYRGFHALQTQRVAHALWTRGRRVLAVALQSRVSEVLAVDIHPAAVIGRGVVLCGGGVVIGATAVVGDGATISQNVTLGSTGKESGDRHPKVRGGGGAAVAGRAGRRRARHPRGARVLWPMHAHFLPGPSSARWRPTSSSAPTRACWATSPSAVAPTSRRAQSC